MWSHHASPITWVEFDKSTNLDFDGFVMEYPSYWFCVVVSHMLFN